MKYFTMIFSAFMFFSYINFANAEVKKIGQVGNWEIFSGTSQNGTPLCTIGTTSQRGDRSLAIKYFENDNGLELDIYNDSWNIVSNVDISIQFYIDNNDRYKVIAGKDKNTNHSLFWFVGKDSIREFENEIRNGNYFKIHFIDEDEPDWTISLNGADGAMNQLAICIENMNKAGAPSTPQFDVPLFRPHLTPPAGPTFLTPTPKPPTPTPDETPQPRTEPKSVIQPHSTPHLNNTDT